MKSMLLHLRMAKETTRQGDHLVADPDCVIDVDGRAVPVAEVAWYLQHGEWPASVPVPGCGTENCIRHLELEPDDAVLMQAHVLTAPARTLADLFRSGRSRGLFRGAGSYRT